MIIESYDSELIDYLSEMLRLHPRESLLKLINVLHRHDAKAISKEHILTVALDILLVRDDSGTTI